MDSNSDVAEVKALTEAKAFLRQAEAALRAATDAVIAANPYDNKLSAKIGGLYSTTHASFAAA